MEALPPFSPEAEEATIAACLLDTEAVWRVRSIVEPDDFFRDQNKHAYQAILNVADEGMEATIPTVVDELDRLDPDPAWPVYLTELTGKYYTAVGVEAHAKIVARDAYFRRLISAAGEIAKQAYEGGNVSEVQSASLRSILTLRAPEEKDAPSPMGGEDVFSVVDGVKVGVPVLDKYLHGLSGGKLTTLAGPSGQGKSMLAAHIARHFAAQSKKVFIASMEMSAKEYSERLIRQMTGLVGQPESNDDWLQVQRAQEEQAEWDLIFWGKARITLEQIVARATTFQPDLIVIDYLQLMGLPNTKETEASKLGYVTSGLKQLAVDLNAHVLLLSQMNRGAAAELRGKDATKRECIITYEKYPVPFIESLKGSGSIEQDSDHVLLMAKHPNCNPGKHLSLVLAKNRHGMQGVECLMVEDFAANSFRTMTQDDITTVAKGDVTQYRALMDDQGFYDEPF